MKLPPLVFLLAAFILSGASAPALSSGSSGSPAEGQATFGGVGGSWLLLHIPAGLVSLNGSMLFHGVAPVVAVGWARYDENARFEESLFRFMGSGELGASAEVLGVAGLTEKVAENESWLTLTLQVGCDSCPPITEPYYLLTSVAGLPENWSASLAWSGTPPVFAFGNSSYLWRGEDFTGTRADAGALVPIVSADVLATKNFHSDGVALGIFSSTNPHPSESLWGPRAHLACPCTFMNATGTGALGPGDYSAHLTQADVGPFQDTELVIIMLPPRAFNI